MSRWQAAALLVFLAATAARAQDPLAYTFDVTLSPDVESLRGEGRIVYRHTGREPLTALPLLLYGARFRTRDPAINDQNFDRFYARLFDPGDMRLERAEAGGQALEVRAVDAPGVPAGCRVDLVLPRPLPPGEQIEVRLGFSLKVAERLGTFGHDRGRLVLEAGWLPSVVAGEGPPPRASFDLRFDWAPGDDPPGPIHVAGRTAKPGQRVQFVARAPSLIAGDDAVSLIEVGAIGDAPAVRVIGEDGDEDRAERIARLAQRAGSFFRGYLPAGTPSGTVTFAEAPLRDRFAHASEDVVLLSSRLFHLFIALQGFHELEVIRATIQALTRQHLRDVPLGRDRDWICEAAAWFVTQEMVQDRSGLDGATIRAGLDWLSFIPAIDRLVRAPRFAGSDLFYGRFYESDESVPDGFSRALSRRARGRVVLEKLRDKIGAAKVEQLVRVLLSNAPARERAAFRQRASLLAGEDLGAFFALWLGPAPVQNLRVESVETEERPDGTEDVTVTIQRDGDPRLGVVGDAVEVEGEGPDEERIVLRWAGTGMRGQVRFRGHYGLFAPVELDPNLRVDQTRHNDDQSPYFPVKILFNRFRVRIDLNRNNRNEIAVGATLHPYHDYRHAVKVDAFYEQDGQGLSLNYGYGFGTVIDERTFGAGLGIGLVAQSVNEGVLVDQEESEGDLLSFGFGASFDTRLNKADPTWGVGVDVGVSYADTLFDTDFRFTTYSGSLAFVWSFVRGTSIAGEVIVGQIEGNKRVPTQSLFDAGGEGSVRGVKASRFVDRAILVFRGELRHMLFTDLDVPILWLAWLRKVQVAAFLDAGDVGPTVESIVRDDKVWKWGAGGGIRLFLDSFGVTPLTLRFDVGVRFDEKAEDNDPQFYVGAGQSF